MAGHRDCKSPTAGWSRTFFPPRDRTPPLEDKATLRKTLMERRREAFQADLAAGSAAGQRLMDHFFREGPNVPENAVVAGFWPFRTEIDVRPLMERLRAKGAQIALPHAPDRLGHLDFRRYDGGPPRAMDAWGLPAPELSAPALTPDIVLAPLLGFDRKGGRIGYGAALYDRALTALRANGTVVAVGVGFAVQEVDEIPREAHDVLLDWIITEEGVKLRPA